MLGSPMVCLDKWSAAGRGGAAARPARSRWTMLVPTMALQLSLVPGSEGALSSLTAMTVGGGPMNAEALEHAEQPPGHEASSASSGCRSAWATRRRCRPTTADVRLGRDGRPFPGTEVRVVDTDGRPLPDGEVGNAQVRGPSLFVGYARDGAPQPPELTADGFFPTGDRATINDDGTINIRGREKQIIIRGGRNIDINEVEAVSGGDPWSRPGVRRPGARRPAGGACRRARGLRRRSRWTSTRCASSSGRRTSRSSSGRSSCTPSLPPAEPGGQAQPRPRRSRWRQQLSDGRRRTRIVLAEAVSQVS